VFSPNGSYWAHSFDSGTQAPTVTLESVDGGERRVIHQGESIQQVMPGVRPPDLVQLAARDGTKLYGAIYRPARGSPPFPTVVSVYGGPHVQQVGDSWGMSVDLRAQYLAAHGFLVFKLDNRGSARRGLAFEGAIHRRLGTIEVEDQVAGVRWLVEQGLTDPARVGVYGWSYGGYLTAMCLLKAPDTFRVGVAGAPVTDWDGYDTHYTERYMDSPQANPDGYREGSALTFASQLAGKLLLVHGMVDENVHFRHTARLSAALERAGRPFDLMVFPEERHMPRDEPGRRYLEAQVADYFLRHLA
jgi:dipeptidyl-peptidase-4